MRSLRSQSQASSSYGRRQRRLANRVGPVPAPGDHPEYDLPSRRTRPAVLNPGAEPVLDPNVCIEPGHVVAGEREEGDHVVVGDLVRPATQPASSASDRNRTGMRHAICADQCWTRPAVSGPGDGPEGSVYGMRRPGLGNAGHVPFGVPKRTGQSRRRANCSTTMSLPDTDTVPRPRGQLFVSILNVVPSPGIFAKICWGARTICPFSTS